MNGQRSSVVEFRVEVRDGDGWLYWMGHTADEAGAQRVVAEARAEYPHKLFRLVRRTTTDEALTDA